MVLCYSLLNMRRRDFVTQCASIAAGFSVSRLTARADDAVVALEQRISKLMAETNVAGVSVAVIHDAEIAWRRGFGVKAAGSKTAIDVDTMFEAASMSKPVFAYAVLKLCERGLMNLDTPLTQYTPERFLKNDPRLDLITARHVLCHTSGFQNWRSDKYPLKISFNPGEKYDYSGEGYNYLQIVVAHVTKQPIEPFITTNLFKPFGMSLSGYIWNDSITARMARPHGKDGVAKKHRRSSAQDVERYGSAGALLTTPTDYARFLIEVVNPKPADTHRLSETAWKEMLRPHVKVASTNEYTIEWSLGWRLDHTKEGDYFGHGGDNPGFHCFSQARLANKSGIVVMTNSDNGVEFLKQLGPDMTRVLQA
jgi:CubicO group peptidase (beta-lactamase class C family)